jgi:CBS domain containing-hemolysin-like protein
VWLIAPRLPLCVDRWFPVGSIPSVGERVEANGWRFGIVDLDGRRIDKVLATKIDTIKN